MFEDQKTKQKGLVGVTRAIHEFTKQGYTVLMPLADANKYDFVIERNGLFQRVQVKTTSRRTAANTSVSYDVVLESRGGSTKTRLRRAFEQTDYDLLFVLTELNECWIIPTSSITSKSAVTVGTAKYAAYKI